MKMCWLISCSKWISRHPTLSVSFCVFFLAIITNPLFEYALSHNTNSIDAGHIFLNELRAFREPSSEWQIGTLIHTNPLKTHIITKCQHIAAIRTSTNTSTATEHKQHTSFNDDDDDDDDKSYFSLSRFRSHSKVKHTLLHVVILKIHLYDFEFLLNCIATGYVRVILLFGWRSTIRDGNIRNIRRKQSWKREHSTITWREGETEMDWENQRMRVRVLYSIDVRNVYCGVHNHSTVYIWCLLMWCLRKLLSFAFHTISLLVPLWISATFSLFPSHSRYLCRSMCCWSSSSTQYILIRQLLHD